MKICGTCSAFSLAWCSSFLRKMWRLVLTEWKWWYNNCWYHCTRIRLTWTTFIKSHSSKELWTTTGSRIPLHSKLKVRGICVHKRTMRLLWIYYWVLNSQKYTKIDSFQCKFKNFIWFSACVCKNETEKILNLSLRL